MAKHWPDTYIVQTLSGVHFWPRLQMGCGSLTLNAASGGRCSNPEQFTNQSRLYSVLMMCAYIRGVFNESMCIYIRRVLNDVHLYQSCLCLHPRSAVHPADARRCYLTTGPRPTRSQRFLRPNRLSRGAWSSSLGGAHSRGPSSPNLHRAFSPRAHDRRRRGPSRLQSTSEEFRAPSRYSVPRT